MIPVSRVNGYQSQSTILTVSQRVDGKKILAVEAQSSSGLMLYVIALLELTKLEERLCQGRFINYRPDVRENDVKHDASSVTLNQRQVTFQKFFQDQLEWVANETFNTPVSWGFSIEAANASQLENHFFFTDQDLAVLFKLYWA